MCYIKAIFSILFLGLLLETTASAHPSISTGNIARHLMSLEADMDQPTDVSVHKSGDAYVLDGLNGRVVVFDSRGNKRFSFGRPGSSAGELRLPMGLYIEGDTIYIADTGNHRIAIFYRKGNFLRNIDLMDRKWEGAPPEPSDLIAKEGIIVWTDRKNHRVCRTAIKNAMLVDCWGGEGEGEGFFRYPFMLAADSDGYVYVVDVLNGRIQYFNRRGYYFGTVSGFGFSPGELFRPNGIAIDDRNNIYVTDSYTGKVSVFNSGRFSGMLLNQNKKEISFGVPAGVTLWKDRIYIVDMARDRVEVFRLDINPDPRVKGGSTNTTSLRKNCVTCHLSWHPDYKVDRREKDSPVLPVASPRMCYSCHHGAIIDSRKAIGRGNQHPHIHHEQEDIRKRTDKISKEFPLTADGGLYCGSCHTPHYRPGTEDLRDGDIWLRVSDRDGSLCQRCHISHLASVLEWKYPPKGINHRIGVALAPPPDGSDRKKYTSIEELQRGMPKELMERGAKVDNKQRMICESCHGVHGTQEENLLLMKNGNDELCKSCHKKQATEDKEEARKKGVHPTGVYLSEMPGGGDERLYTQNPDLKKGLPEELKRAGARLGKNGQIICTTCHRVHDGEEDTALLIMKNLNDEMCTACHKQQAAKDREEARRKGIHPVNIRLEKPVRLDGKEISYITCSTCHSTHQGENNSPSLVKNLNNGELCILCHETKKGIIGTDHDARVMARNSHSRLNKTSWNSGPCGACHTMHRGGSDIPFLFAVEVKDVKKVHLQDRLCLSCHREGGIAEKKQLEEYTHPEKSLIFRSKGTLPLYNERMEQEEFGQIRCVTCHDPHRWSQTIEDENRKSLNKEGTVLTSFLRHKGSKGTFCVTCHGLETPVKYKYYHKKLSRGRIPEYLKPKLSDFISLTQGYWVFTSFSTGILPVSEVIITEASPSR